MNVSLVKRYSCVDVDIYHQKHQNVPCIVEYGDKLKYKIMTKRERHVDTECNEGLDSAFQDSDRKVLGWINKNGENGDKKEPYVRIGKLIESTRPEAESKNIQQCPPQESKEVEASVLDFPPLPTTKSGNVASAIVQEVLNLGKSKKVGSKKNCTGSNHNGSCDGCCEKNKRRKTNFTATTAVREPSKTPNRNSESSNNINTSVNMFMSSAAAFANNSQVEKVGTRVIDGKRVECVYVKSACKNCRKSRVKCDKCLPCKRCRRLGIPCEPQLRGRGRPPSSTNRKATNGAGKKSKRNPASNDVNKNGLPLQQPHVQHQNELDNFPSLGNGLKGLGLGLSGFELGEVEGADVNGGNATVGYSQGPAVFKDAAGYTIGKVSAPKNTSNDFSPVAVIERVFLEMHSRGELNVQAATKIIRFWSYIAKVRGLPLLESKANTFANMLKVDISDISKAPKVTQSPVVALGMIPPQCKMKNKWDTDDSAYLERTTFHGTNLFYCNGKFSDWFFSAEEAHQGYFENAGDIIASTFTPADAEFFFTSMARGELSSTATNSMSHILHVKTKQRDCPIKLALVQYHMYYNHNSTVTHLGLRISALPSSPYLSIRDRSFVTENILPGLEMSYVPPNQPQHGTQHIYNPTVCQGVPYQMMNSYQALPVPIQSAHTSQQPPAMNSNQQTQHYHHQMQQAPAPLMVMQPSMQHQPLHLYPQQQHMAQTIPGNMYN